MRFDFGKHVPSLIRRFGKAVFIVCFTLTAFCLPVLSAQMASSQENSSAEKSMLLLRSFTVETKGSSILVESGLVVDQLSNINTLLRDGASINLSCNLLIERLRTLFANETLAEVTVVYQLRHEPLTREFIMIQEGNSPQRSKKLEDLLASTWDVLMFNVPLAAPLVSGETYRVRLHVTLQHAEVPPWLEKALFFWSWDIAPALSFTQEFVY